MTVAQQIYNFLKAKGMTDNAIGGILGNLQAESGLRSNNLEDTRNTTYGISDDEYTRRVDNGTVSRSSFINDYCGYGIAQWTDQSRKAFLYDTCKNNGKSISDLESQLTVLYSELQQRNLVNQMNACSTLREASTIFLKKFEIPLYQGESVQAERARNGENLMKTINKTSASSSTTRKNTMKYSNSNPPLVCMMTNSSCYRETRQMQIKGVLWHSTGANNPNLKRYVQPSSNDANYSSLMQKLGQNANGNDWNHIELQAGLNAWIGKLANGTVAAIQTMPWDYRPWGCGSGASGSCNDGWIQFEICEDNLTDKNYFDTIYQEACELTAYLCKKYNLNPKGSVNFNNKNVPVIICHQDSARLGLGSNHADVYHWFGKFGKSMDNVRNDVAKLMEGNSDNSGSSSESSSSTTVGPLIYTRLLKRGRDGEDVKALQDALIKLGYNLDPWGADGDYGAITEQAVIKFQKDNNLDDDGEAGPMTIAAINKKLSGSSSGNNNSGNTTPSSDSSNRPQMYRVRKSWTDVSSQLGAFTNLQNAIRICKDGYYVFDSSGKVVYPKNATPSSGGNGGSITPAKTYTGVVIGSSSKDERGCYVGGQAGDQTGKEVWTLNWYDQSWTNVLRPKDAQLAENIARQCENACANNNIGYSQSERNTLLAQAKRVGYDMSKINTPCNCDCSSFVSAVCVCCGLPEATFFPGGNGCVTSTIESACLSTGKFTNLTDMKYRNQKNYLKRGDILCNRNQHVVIVLSNGDYA